MDEKEIEQQQDTDIEDGLEGLNRLRAKLEPYNRYIMIAGFIILIMLVVYLGYARGALDVCNDLGGRLEVKKMFGIDCRPGSYNQDNEKFFDVNIITENGME